MPNELDLANRGKPPAQYKPRPEYMFYGGIQHAWDTDVGMPGWRANRQAWLNKYDLWHDVHNGKISRDVIDNNFTDTPDGYGLDWDKAFTDANAQDGKERELPSETTRQAESIMKARSEKYEAEAGRARGWEKVRNVLGTGVGKASDPVYYIPLGAPSTIAKGMMAAVKSTKSIVAGSTAKFAASEMILEGASRVSAYNHKKSLGIEYNVSTALWEIAFAGVGATILKVPLDILTVKKVRKGLNTFMSDPAIKKEAKTNPDVKSAREEAQRMADDYNRIGDDTSAVELEETINKAADDATSGDAGIDLKDIPPPKKGEAPEMPTDAAATAKSKPLQVADDMSVEAKVKAIEEAQKKVDVAEKEMAEPEKVKAIREGEARVAKVEEKGAPESTVDPDNITGFAGIEVDLPVRKPGTADDVMEKFDVEKQFKYNVREKNKIQGIIDCLI